MEPKGASSKHQNMQRERTRMRDSSRAPERRGLSGLAQAVGSALNGQRICTELIQKSGSAQARLYLDSHDLLKRGKIYFHEAAAMESDLLVYREKERVVHA